MLQEIERRITTTVIVKMTKYNKCYFVSVAQSVTVGKKYVVWD